MSIIVTIWGDYKIPKGARWEVEEEAFNRSLVVYSKSGKQLYRFAQAEVLGVMKGEGK